jgi:hypothetical protein
MKNDAGESVFGVFLLSPDGSANVLQHFRALHSLRFLAAKLSLDDSFLLIVIPCKIAGFCTNSSTQCRVTIISISASSLPATLMPSSCYGKVSALVAIPRASRRLVCLGRRAATCCISRFCAVSAFSVCSICECPKQKCQSPLFSTVHSYILHCP